MLYRFIGIVWNSSLLISAIASDFDESIRHKFHFIGPGQL